MLKLQLADSILSQINKADQIHKVMGGDFESFVRLIGNIYVSKVTYVINDRLSLKQYGSAKTFEVYLDGIKVDTLYAKFETILGAIETKLADQKRLLIQQVIRMNE